MSMYVMSGQNLAREVREVVDDELSKAGDTYVAGLVAQKVVDRLRQEAPELLAKFLDQHAVPVVTQMIGDISRSQRSAARANSGRSVFAKAAQRQEAGEPRAMSSWLDTYYVVTSGNQRKQLGDMYQVELEFAARDYRERSRTNALQAAFLEALANRVGARAVREVFDNDQLASMWASLE